MKKVIVVISLTSLILLTCNPPPEEDFFQLIQIASSKGSQNDIYELKRLVKLIQSSKYSIYGAFSSLENMEVTDALIEAYNRGVNVKIVGDEDFADNEGFIALQNENIPITFGDGTITYMPDPTISEVLRKGNMNKMTHNFVIVDDLFIWNSTGSVDDLYKISSLSTNFLIQSQDIAEDFIDEFNQLFGGVFSTTFDVYDNSLKSVADARSHYLINDVDFELYFGPQERLIKQVIDEVYLAKSSIYFITDHFQNDFLFNALKYKKDNGFVVKGVLEDQYIKDSTELASQFKNYNFDVKKDSSNTEIKETIFIIDHEKARNGRYYPLKIMILSHGIFNAYSYIIDTSPNPDVAIPIESDSFCDGNMWIINNYGLSEEVIFDEFIEHFFEIYQKGENL